MKAFESRKISLAILTLLGMGNSGCSLVDHKALTVKQLKEFLNVEKNVQRYFEGQKTSVEERNLLRAIYAIKGYKMDAKSPRELNDPALSYIHSYSWKDLHGKVRQINLNQKFFVVHERSRGITDEDIEKRSFSANEVQAKGLNPKKVPIYVDRNPNSIYYPPLWNLVGKAQDISSSQTPQGLRVRANRFEYLLKPSGKIQTLRKPKNILFAPPGTEPAHDKQSQIRPARNYTFRRSGGGK